jgi:hypothetical protein
VLDAELFAGACEGFRAIAAAVVGHDAIDANTETGEVGDRLEQKCNGAFLFLVGKDLGNGHPGVIVNSHVDALPSRMSSARVAGPILCDAIADSIETTELFDVEMDELARRGTLIAWPWLLRLEC